MNFKHPDDGYWPDYEGLDEKDINALQKDNIDVVSLMRQMAARERAGGSAYEVADPKEVGYSEMYNDAQSNSSF